MLFKEKIIIAVGGYKITDILSVIASSASGKKFRMIINIELFMKEKIAMIQ